MESRAELGKATYRQLEGALRHQDGAIQLRRPEEGFKEVQQ